MSLIKRIRGPIKQLFNPTDRISFVVAGSQKSGTTALDRYLREHPQICMPKKKELHYFDRDENFNPKPDYSMYHYYFSPERDQQILGEVTPAYIYWHPAMRRIWEYNPDMKIIVLLRNPVSRAFSHWNMQRERGIETRPFWQAVREEEETCREALPRQNRKFSYTARGFYSDQLRRMWTFFPRQQTVVLKNTDLRDTPKTTLDSISALLGIEPFSNTERKRVHSRKKTVQMTDQEKEYLKSIYEFEIKELERLLGWDCSDWLQ